MYRDTTSDYERLCIINIYLLKLQYNSLYTLDYYTPGHRAVYSNIAHYKHSTQTHSAHPALHIVRHRIKY